MPRAISVNKDHELVHSVCYVYSWNRDMFHDRQFGFVIPPKTRNMMPCSTAINVF